MNNPPMTTFGGDGKAPKPAATQPKMSDQTNVEDVESQMTNEERYADTSLTAEVDEDELLESFGLGDGE